MSSPTTSPFLPLSFISLALFVCAASVSRPSEAATQSDPPTTAVDAPVGQCGFVSTRQGVVPESDNVFPANITQIDGDSTSFMKSNRQKVAAGSHTLTISEAIEQNRLTAAQLAQIRKMKKFAYARAYKPLVVDVKPDMSYRIGARLHPDKLDAQSIHDNAYWEPVVWQEVPEACP